MVAGIYLIKNTKTGVEYIGSSNDCKRRFGYHKASLRGKYHDNLWLQRSWDKHGEDNFSFAVVEEIKDLNFLRAREQCWINRRSPAYNQDLDAWGKPKSTPDGIRKGLKSQWSSEERKAAHKARMLGNKHAVGNRKSPEALEKLREQGRTTFLGKTHSIETKTKISEKRKLLFASGYVDIRKGTKLQDEVTREKMRVSSSKRWYGEFWLEKFVEKHGRQPNV